MGLAVDQMGDTLSATHKNSTVTGLSVKHMNWGIGAGVVTLII